MAKARSRTTARRRKDRWKSKKWYNVVAPPSFDSVTIADTLSDDPEKLINRVTEVSLQDLTDDFRKSHIKLYFKIQKVEDDKAYTRFAGHTLTSDYIRRLVRRRRSKIDAVHDVKTRDGAKIRVKPFATTDKRIQNSQKKVIRKTMRQTITKKAKSSTLAEFAKDIMEGKMGKDIYMNCKKLYPVKRVEIYKTEVSSFPDKKIETPATKEKKEKTTEEKKETEELEKEESKEKQKEDSEETEKPEKETKEEEKEEQEKKEKPKKKEKKENR